ncbi:MAG: VTT domain-containing protein [bacterium]
MDIFLSILSVVQSFGYWGYVIAFLFAFTESLALIGGFIPGSTAVVILGFMSANGYLDPVVLSALVVLGAILGDSVSYWLGTKGTHLFKEENKILKASHLEIGKNFFHKHGDKSIFLGRFIGVIRPMIPFAAGLARMKQSRFIFWNILSGIIWGVSHIYLGYFFGGALKAIELVSKRLAIFLLFLVASAFVIWFVIRVSRPAFSLASRYFHTILRRVLNSGIGLRITGKYPGTYNFISERFLADHFYGWPLTVLITALTAFILLFALVADGVLDHQSIISLDQRVSGFFYYFRDISLVRFSLWASLFGNFKVVIIFSSLFVIILTLWNKRHYIIPFIFSVTGGAGLAGLIKVIVNRARPEGVLPVYYEPMASFPSGHSVIAVALYGFIAYVLFRVLLKRKKHFLFALSLFVVIVFVSLVGLSRIYLGVHYFSDVIGGYLIGAISLMSSITFFKWSRHHKIFGFWTDYYILGKKTLYFLTIFIVLIGISFYIIFGTYYYKPIFVNNSHPIVLSQEGGKSTLEVFNNLNWSVYVEGVSGVVQAPVNLIFWAKNRGQIENLFITSQWVTSDEPSVSSLFKIGKRLALGQNYDSIPLLPYFWNEMPNDFSFEKNQNLSGNIKYREQVRVWNTSAVDRDGRKMFIASIISSSRFRLSPVFKIYKPIGGEVISTCELLKGTLITNDNVGFRACEVRFK